VKAQAQEGRPRIAQNQAKAAVLGKDVLIISFFLHPVWRVPIAPNRMEKEDRIRGAWSPRRRPQNCLALGYSRTPRPRLHSWGSRTPRLRVNIVLGSFSKALPSLFSRLSSCSIFRMHGALVMPPLTQFRITPGPLRQSGCFSRTSIIVV
jgi:hypothetical protein